MSKNSPSLPEPFIRRIEKNPEIDLQSFFRSYEEAPPVSIRINPVKDRGRFNGMKEVAWCSQGRYLNERPSFTLDPLFHSGAYYVQEAGSMLIGQMVSVALQGIKEPLVLDLCASPGGKTTHVLSHLNGDGLLISNEIIPKRNQVLLQNTIKWGYPNLIVTQSEASSFSESGIQFDLVLVDAPCSGEGLFRRDSDACNHWSEEQVMVCASRQQLILENIVEAIKPGGYLIYSTCTFGEVENDLQAEWLIQKYGFINRCPVAPKGIIMTSQGWQAWPHIVPSEGFWCTLLQKPFDAENTKTKRRNNYIKPVKFERAGEWLKDQNKFQFILQNDRILGLTQQSLHILPDLQKSCYLKNAGLSLGTMKNKDFIPSADLALSLDCTDNILKLDLNKNQALHFLHGNTQLEPPDGNGWVLICFEGLGMGWGKYTSGRWNNYYPKEWRIIMKPDQWKL